MSTREAVLCDKTVPGKERSSLGSGRPNIKTPGNKCPGMAIGKCPLCDDDVCVDHALHPKGGIVLTLQLMGLNIETQPPMDRKIHEMVCTLPVCIECGRRVTGSDFEVAAQAITAALAVEIRAALAAKALMQTR
jgi:hypothetical protein